MKILIVYGTTDGQTKKICQHIFEEIEKTGHNVSFFNVNNAREKVEGYHLYIIGSSIHAGLYQKTIQKFVSEHKHILNEKPTAFISVSLSAASDAAADVEELRSITKTFLDKTGWNPNHVLQVAGALLYSKYNFIIKFIMKRISKEKDIDMDTSRDYEYTDWKQVSDFVHILLEKYEHAHSG